MSIIIIIKQFPMNLLNLWSNFLFGFVLMLASKEKEIRWTMMALERGYHIFPFE